MIAKTRTSRNQIARKLQTMSRIFRAYHPYYPYDPYLHEELNQTAPYYLDIASSYSKSKDGKVRKDHMVQTFRYTPEPMSRVSHCSLLSSSWQRGISS